MIRKKMDKPLSQISSMCTLEKTVRLTCHDNLRKMQNTTESFLPRATCGNNLPFATRTTGCSESSLTISLFKHLPTYLNASAN